VAGVSVLPKPGRIAETINCLVAAEATGPAASSGVNAR
jgi:hypothetical protein